MKKSIQTIGCVFGFHAMQLSRLTGHEDGTVEEVNTCRICGKKKKETFQNAIRYTVGEKKFDIHRGKTKEGIKL